MKSAEWDERYRSTDRLWSATPNIFVEDRLGPREPGTGLDLASGEGRNAVWLARRGWTMTAVDFSAVAVNRGREQADDVEFVVADVVAWEPDRAFDLVLIAYLHLDEEALGPLFRRAARWLAPGGEIFLIGHDRSNIEHGYGGPQVLEILWDRETIVDWLGEMEIVEAQVVRRPVEVDGEMRVARDTLIRATPLGTGLTGVEGDPPELDARLTVGDAAEAIDTIGPAAG